MDDGIAGARIFRRAVMNRSDIALAEEVLLCLIQDRSIDAARLPKAMEEFGKLAIALQTMQRELRTYTENLSKGNLDVPFPPSTNQFAAHVRQLHSQILHLTWQARCVTEGDYSQRVEFIGDFSAAFNRMVVSLSDRENYLREQREAMYQVFEKLDIGILIESAGRILYENKAAAAQRSADRDLLKRMRALPVNVSEHEICDSRAEKWFLATVCTVHWENDEEARLYSLVDITEQKQRELELEQMALVDAVTGVTNRYGLNLSLTKSWDECKFTKKPLSLLIFDIDDFKAVNDTYGHSQGDICLKTVGAILRASVSRQGDTVARYGGEEFCILLPGAGKEAALRIAEAVRGTVAQTKIPIAGETGESIDFSVTISCGVSTTIPDDEVYPSLFLNAADKALYKAKRSDKNKVCYGDVSKTRV